jgi:3-phytase
MVGAWIAAIGLAAGCASPQEPPAASAQPSSASTASAMAPVGKTAPVPHESDDPAIWRHPTDPARSLILGTDKIEQIGGLYVFGLDGGLRQSIAPLDRPNNVDVEYGVTLGARTWDIAVVTERKKRRLRLFGIDANGRLSDLAPAGLPVFAGETGERAEPMGVGVYRRPSDGAVFVVVSPKAGPRDGYLAQYRLSADAAGRPRLHLVRRFGAFSGMGPTPGEPGEIEAIVVDDALGYVYYSDEGCCLRKYLADPGAPDSARELARFGETGYLGDREGLGVFDLGQGRGFLVSVDQTPGQSSLLFYPREGDASGPHQHVLAHRASTASDETDGLDVRADIPLTGHTSGLVVTMHNAGRNFHLYAVPSVVERPR